MQIDAPIGVFDSGVGGLTVVREIDPAASFGKYCLFWRYGPGALRNEVQRHDY